MEAFKIKHAYVYIIEVHFFLFVIVVILFACSTYQRIFQRKLECFPQNCNFQTEDY